MIFLIASSWEIRNLRASVGSHGDRCLVTYMLDKSQEASLNGNVVKAQNLKFQFLMPYWTKFHVSLCFILLLFKLSI